MSRPHLSQTSLTERRLETRNTFRRIGMLALPGFMSSLMVYLMNLLNYLILAAFSDYTSIASYGIVSSYTTLAAGFFVPLSLGAGYLMEEAQKKNDNTQLQNVINSITLIAFFMGITAAAFGFLIAPAYVWQVVTPEEIREITTLFLRYFSFTYIPIIYFSISTTVLIHLGEKSAPIMAEISALVLHASFSYIFVGLFHWDIRGIAISAIVAQTVGTLINVHQLSQRMKMFVDKVPVRFDRSIAKTLAGKEKAAVLTAVLGGVFTIFLQFFIDELGIMTIAAFALFFLFQDLLFIPIHALRSPARSMSAEAYEKDGTDGLARVITPIVLTAAGYSLLLIPLTRLIGPPLFMLFSHDPEVSAIGMKLIDLVSSYYLFYAVSTLLSSSLEGLGKKGVSTGINIGFNFFGRLLVMILTAMLIRGEESIAICYPVSWALCTASLGIYYFATYSKSQDYAL